MKLHIETKEKLVFFISLFQQLRLFTKTLCIFFNDDNIYIQGMDASHVCLYESKLMSDWFYYYEKKEATVLKSEYDELVKKYEELKQQKSKGLKNKSKKNKSKPEEPKEPTDSELEEEFKNFI